ncbi:hypothetical protein [Arthrobacter sp. TB 23]|uniref:hypothetical protein n=1 Tax=Arthrobacter sp. TB 23 TaxID=494419 RepID=UPI0012E9E76E|nr:hypothetical protein [Arthrobacter sp. TB 23]
MASTLRERTERILADVAPYEHITTVTATKATANAVNRDPAIPILRIDGVTVASSSERDSLPAEAGGFLVADRELPIIPSEEEILAALTAAVVAAGPGSIRLPLRHRRFIMVGASLVLAAPC